MDVINTKDETFMETLKRFWEEMPFNQFLGMVIENFDEKNLSLVFTMKDEFIGNNLNGKQLHGGVIASIIDTTGGMLASISEVKKRLATPTGRSQNVFNKGGTIDLRVDYLRPGVGKTFEASGTVVKHGTNVIVTKMELKNDRESLIALGMGTYYVG